MQLELQAERAERETLARQVGRLKDELDHVKGLVAAVLENSPTIQQNQAFLNGFIAEEVYVEQPPGFENHEFPNHVFKLSKALYGMND